MSENVKSGIYFFKFEFGGYVPKSQPKKIITSQGKRPDDALMDCSKQQALEVTAKAVPGIR